MRQFIFSKRGIIYGAGKKQWETLTLKQGDSLKVENHSMPDSTISIIQIRGKKSVLLNHPGKVGYLVFHLTFLLLPTKGKNGFTIRKPGRPKGTSPPLEVTGRKEGETLSLNSQIKDSPGFSTLKQVKKKCFPPCLGVLGQRGGHLLRLEFGGKKLHGIIARCGIVTTFMS